MLKSYYYILQQSGVNINVFFSRNIPGKIDFHDISHKLRPFRFIGIHCKCIIDDFHHLMCIVIFEGEAIAGSFVFVVSLNGICQTAAFTDDRNGTVTGCDHLGQTAGFALGGHQEHIRTCVELLGKNLVVLQLDAHLCGIAHRQNSSREVSPVPRSTN